MLGKMKIDHVVFDLDGTLIDSSAGIMSALQHSQFEFPDEILGKHSLHDKYKSAALLQSLTTSL